MAAGFAPSAGADEAIGRPAADLRSSSRGRPGPVFSTPHASPGPSPVRSRSASARRGAPAPEFREAAPGRPAARRLCEPR